MYKMFLYQNNVVLGKKSSCQLLFFTLWGGGGIVHNGLIILPEILKIVTYLFEN